MPYVSARYMPPGPIDPPGAPRQIQAIDDQGQVWALTEDSQVGDWLRYLEEGGKIDPAPEPELTTVPEPAPEFLPESESTASDLPTDHPLVMNQPVPRAEPDVVYGEPQPE